jgi:hypothetical protein
MRAPGDSRTGVAVELHVVGVHHHELAAQGADGEGATAEQRLVLGLRAGNVLLGVGRDGEQAGQAGGAKR